MKYFYSQFSVVKMFTKSNICLKYLTVSNRVQDGETTSTTNSTVKPVLSGHSKRTPKLVFNTDNHLMQVKSIAECSPWSILQYF